jgi:tripartite-type tricarboxylate transporter receptor subunit TctC
MASTSVAINATLLKHPPYDALRDLAAVSHIVNLPNALFAYPAFPVANVAEMIAYARRDSGKINYGSGGTGSAAHLAMELLRSRAGVDLVHVPYRGGNLALTDLIAGRISVMFISVYTALPHANSGKLKSLGVASRKRSETVPDWPTIDESGMAGFEFNAWYGVMVPARTPARIVATLNREIAGIMRLPEIRGRSVAQGAEVIGGSVEEFSNLFRAEVAKWGAVVKASGAEAN